MNKEQLKELSTIKLKALSKVHYSQFQSINGLLSARASKKKYTPTQFKAKKRCLALKGHGHNVVWSDEKMDCVSLGVLFNESIS